MGQRYMRPIPRVCKAGRAFICMRADKRAAGVGGVGRGCCYSLVSFNIGLGLLKQIKELATGPLRTGASYEKGGVSQAKEQRGELLEFSM